MDILKWSEGNTPTDGTLHISWREAFECGHPVLDAQHRRLFGIGNELVRAVASKRPKAEMELLIDKFVDHMKTHLETESQILTQTKTPKLLDWQKQRNFLLTKAKVVRESFRMDELTARELAGFATYDVVVEHIIRGDIKSLLARKNAKKAKAPPVRQAPHRSRINSGRVTGDFPPTEIGPDSWRNVSVLNTSRRSANARTSRTPDTDQTPDTVWGETYFR